MPARLLAGGMPSVHRPGRRESVPPLGRGIRSETASQEGDGHVDLYDSLHSIPLDQLAEKVGGRHKLTFLIAQRLCQINAGSPLLVEQGENEALLAAVCRELDEGKIWLEIPDEEIRSEQSDLDILGIETSANDA